MAHTTDPEPSIATLVRGVLDDMRELFREEVALARAEAREELTRLQQTVLLAGVSAGAAFFAGFFLLFAVALGIATLFGWPAWTGFATVGVLLGAVAMVTLFSVRQKVATMREHTGRTIDTMKEGLEWRRRPTSSESR